jgi:Zn-dependent protease
LTFVFVTVFWVFSVCLHEFGHAIAAYLGGDKSVKDKGYLSLNPVHYMNPMYSILMPLLFLLFGGLGLPGGAVYINDSRLRGKYWSIAVSLAGPAANLLLAFVLAFALQFETVMQSNVAPTFAFLAWLQVSAVVFNLIPIPPLDGYRAVSVFLSPQTRSQFDGVANMAIWLLFALFLFSREFATMFFGIISSITADMGVPTYLVVEGWRDFFFWKPN